MLNIYESLDTSIKDAFRSYDPSSTVISAEEHRRNMAILLFLGRAGRNPLIELELRDEGVDEEVAEVFGEEARRAQGTYAPVMLTDKGYDGFMDLDAWQKARHQ